MALSELATDFERLMGRASKINKALLDETNDPQDSIFVLAMIAAFIINTHRQDGVPIEVAQDAFCGLVRGLSNIGEHADEQETRQ